MKRQEEKNALRQKVKEALSQQAAVDAAAASARACARLIERDAFQSARVVMAYVAIPGELDTVDLLRVAWESGKTVLLPRVDWTTREMVAVPVDDLSELTEGRYSILEPADGTPLPVELIDLVVVPALAFDNRGRRLGRGGGFYDRFLARDGLRARTCGLAYDCQLVPAVPVDLHDRLVDVVVTDQRVLEIHSNGRADPPV